MNAMPVNEQAAFQPKLPINIGWRTFGYVFRNFGTVMRVGFLPLLLIVAAYTLLYIYFPPEMVHMGGQMVPQQQFLPSLFVTPFTLLATTMFVVGVHRLAILGERPTSFFHLRFQREEVKYVLVAIIITVVFVALVAAITAVTLLFVQFEGANIPGMPREI